MNDISWPDLVKLAATKAPDQVMRIRAAMVLRMSSAILERDDTITQLNRRATTLSGKITEHETTIRNLRKELETHDRKLNSDPGLGFGGYAGSGLSELEGEAR